MLVDCPSQLSVLGFSFVFHDKAKSLLKYMSIHAFHFKTRTAFHCQASYAAEKKLLQDYLFPKSLHITSLEKNAQMIYCGDYD